MKTNLNYCPEQSHPGQYPTTIGYCAAAVSNAFLRKSFHKRDTL